MSDVEDEFNAARRNEESQRGLISGTLDNLALPSNFLSLTTPEQALLLITAERACRNGVNYGSGALTVLPLEGVELNLNTVAQGHADWMSSTGNFGHAGSGGSSSSSRINGAFPMCTEGTGENIAWNSMTGGGFILGIPLAIYGFIYDDSFHSWGHRTLCLGQFSNNNYGDPNKLGLVGFGRATGSNGDYFVMDYLDPIPSCSYDVTNYGAGSGGGCPIHVDVDGMIVSGTFMADQTLASDGTVMSGATVDFQAGASITLENNFTTQSGAELIITIDDCTIASLLSVLPQQHALPHTPTFKMGSPQLSGGHQANLDKLNALE
ncbi:MAG: hypothetical protein HKN87_14700 [Saprospiraceae bacterium]|nr:hypothetical protein [Saprospiraceae bacterium]